ncbi:MAG: TolC family protein [Acidobacteria bacterium]|jgi:outer membrane protein TolC|nr:TolC family protein [Acidobacteriota bacterium]
MTQKRLCGALVALILVSGLGFGQETGDVTLTLEDSIVRALKNNLNIAAEVINPGLASASLSQAKQMYTPTLEFDWGRDRYEQLSTWSLQQAGTYINKGSSASTSVLQRIPFGGTFQASLNYDKSESNQLFQNYNPSYTSRLSFSLTQPLLKNFGWTVSRREILIAQNSFEVSRSQFEGTLIETVYGVETAYWNLVYSIENLGTLRQSLESGRDLLAKTKREVQVGTKAPIEVLNAEATVARREADILQAEALVKRNQDQLRTLLNLGVDPQGRKEAVLPADKPAFRPYAITVEEAYGLALARRPDLEVSKSTIENKAVNYRVAKNQRLPQLDLRLVKASPGISGRQYLYDPGNPFGDPIGVLEGSASQAFKDSFKFLYNNWTAGLTLTIPFGDIVGKAQYAYAKLDLAQAQARLKSQEQQIYLEVSDAVRTLETAAKAVDAYRVARELAERQLEAEMKKLNVGMSTNYFVLTYQDALASARTMEMRALVDYNIAMATIARVTGTTLQARNITVGDYLK